MPACVPGMAALLTIMLIGQMDDHCTNNIKWDQLTADERELPYYKGHGWCDDLSGMTGFNVVSLLVTLFATAAGVMAACFSSDLYLDEELDEDSG
jgi:hypothetical protein|eukprot:COSAG02_NODE_1644_length_11524_cov_76.342232_10_plen_95_part_00